MKTLGIVSYGFLAAPAAMSLFILVTYLPTFYAVDLGLGLGFVGLVVGLGRIFDALTDPFLGNLSDNTQTRFGARIPWIVPGLLFFCASAWFLFVPETGVGQQYFLLLISLFFLSYTAYEVPYAATGLEISDTTHGRTLYAGSKTAVQILSLLAGAAIFSVFNTDNAIAMRTVAIAILASALVGLVFFLCFVPRIAATNKPQRVGLIVALKAARTDSACQKLIMAFLLTQASSALIVAQTVLFIAKVIGSPEKTGSFILLFSVCSAVFLPVWVMLSKRIGKAQTWRVAIYGGAACLLLPIFMSHETPYLPMIFFGALGVFLGCDSVMSTSMLADAVAKREETVTTKVAGLYLSLKNAVAKLAFIVPMVIAFPLLDLAGAGNETYSESTVKLAFIGLFSILPLALRLLALQALKDWPVEQRSVHK